MHLLSTLLYFSLLILPFKAAIYHNYSTWMSDLDSQYNFYNRKLFDIVLPGSNKAGMNYDNLVYLWANDTFSRVLSTQYTLSSTTHGTIAGWAQRHEFPILKQLQLGARFLDLQFQCNDTYYTYNGIFGQNISSIISDINTFRANGGENEIIVISLSNFIDDGTLGLRNDQLDTLLSALISGLGATNIATTSLYPNLNSVNLTELDSAGKRIILFSDENPSLNIYLYDSNTYLLDSNKVLYSDNSSSSSSVSFNSVRSTLLSSLLYGWNNTKINIMRFGMYYNSFQTLINSSSSWKDYSTEFLFTMDDIIFSYPKIFWANVILADFFEASTATELAILLNVNYYGSNGCIDSLRGDSTSDCASSTDLNRDYKYSNLSTQCSLTTSLQTTCQRSCGLCPYLSGFPGSSCNDSNTCNSAFASTCHIRTSDESNYITESSFCLISSPQASCGSVPTSGDCSSSETTVSSDCEYRCSADYQCSTNYCSSDYFVCLTISPANTTTVTTTVSPDNQYNFVESTLAIQFRSDIDILRPGNPDGPYEFHTPSSCSSGSYYQCFMDAKSQNPYINSILGFILGPIIISIVLLILYCGCCVNWLCCDHCAKKCCCECCLGDPRQNKVAKWVPCGLLTATLAVIVYFCIEGLQYNQEMHKHLYTNNDSMSNEVSYLFDDIINRIDNMQPTIDSIINESFDILSSIANDTLEAIDIDTLLDTLYSGVYDLAAAYSEPIIITANFTNPLSGATQYVNLTCDFCNSITSTIVSINETVASSAGQLSSGLSYIYNFSNYLSSGKEYIRDQCQALYDQSDSIASKIEDVQDKANKYLNISKSYDEQRETYGNVFFAIPLIWLIFPIIGIALSWKWCFKANWCTAMYIGVIVMFLFSIFAFVTVGWADLCVRLDDFEQNFGDSLLGEQLFENVGDPSISGNISIYSVVNACFTGESLLDVFGLTSYFDLDSYKQNISQYLDIDITKYLQISELNDFQTAIDLLDVSEFYVFGDSSIADANSESGCYCNGTTGYAFSRDNLHSSSDCFNDTSYWSSVSTSCVAAAVEAYGAVQAEDQSISIINSKIQALQDAADVVFDVYDSIYTAAENVEAILSNVTCRLDPIFTLFDNFIDYYAQCGFIGDHYEDFKRIACVDLFGDMYYISRSIAVISFISILVVFFSFMMDYVVQPSVEEMTTTEKQISSNIYDETELQKMENRSSINDPYGNTSNGEGQDTNNIRYV